MFMLSFFEILKGVLENIDYFRSFFCKMIVKTRSVDSQNGVLCANPRTKGVWEYKNWKYKIKVFYVNGCLS
jgi:hypothetical protein